MTDPSVDTLAEAIRRGQAADRIFNDPLMVEAFEALSTDIIRRWATSAPADVAGRERLKLEHDMVYAVRDKLRGYVTSGQFAAEEVKRRGWLERVRDLMAAKKGPAI